MATSSLVNYLSQMTDPDDDSFKEPFTIVVGNDKWTAASDRVWFVAVRGAGSYPLWDTDEDRIRNAKNLLSCTPTDAAISVSTSDLLAWAKSEDDDIHPGMVAGVVVNRVRLVQLLTGLPFSNVLVWDASEVVGKSCLGLAAGDRWRAFLAGLIGSVKAETTFTPNAQRSTFDALMVDD
jgi:hypothetical protein